ncbi:MAG: aldehyde dehydrogenase (NADP(+)) [Cytophagaceae bacterium]|nr:aldehyde dehydrogenase (NADP(+)) [Cytophagaceae bacterium]
MIAGKNYIGNTQSAKGDTTYKTRNPRTDAQNPWTFHQASSEEIDQAVAKAKAAFAAYQQISGKQRAAFLEAIAQNILDLGDILIQTYVAESGLPEGRAQGERGRTIGQLRMFATLIQEEKWRNPTIDPGDPKRQPFPKPDLRKVFIPLGPVVVFGASNFPLAFSTAGGDTASALAAGCPVIVKSHPMHAGTSELVASAVIKAARDTQMPDGIFSHLNSAGHQVGASLVAHPDVKAVGFTGSITGGRALYDIAAQREEPIPVFAEMGSVNPVVITQNALAHRAQQIAETYAGSISLGAGQFCTNPGLILAVKGEALDDFIQHLGTYIEKQESQCMLHSSIKSAYTHNSMAIETADGVHLVTKAFKDEPGHLAAPKIAKVDGAVFLANPALQQEVFGPFSLVVQCEDRDQLERIIHTLEGQLTATIIAENQDHPHLSTLISALQSRVGRIIFNGVPTGVEVSPAMTHGGPYPASSDPRFSAIGTQSILRWVRPFSYQDFPENLLPDYLK